MTQSINKPFKANDAAEQVKQFRDALILETQVAQAKGLVKPKTESKPAPAVAKVQQGLVPAPKAAKTSPVKKSGRVVGISADENKFLKELLDLYNNKEMDYNAFIESNKAAYDKLIGRYNK